MLTSKQRAKLKSAANGIPAVFQIGKGGVDQPVIKATDDCLAKRELVKVKLLETSPLEAREAAEILAEATGAEVVQVIGRAVVLFRKKKKNSAFLEVLGGAS